MISTQNLIIAAYRKIGFAAGETPSSDELADGLLAFQNLFDSWSAQAVPIPQISRRLIPLTGAGSYGLFARPVKIKAAKVNTGGLEVGVSIATAEEWSAGAGTFARPAIWYDGGYPNGTLYIRPAPTGTLEYYAYEPLAGPTDLSASLDLPPGYNRPLIWELALEMAEEFGFPVTENLMKRATDAKVSINGLNAATLGAPVPVGPQPTNNQG